MPNCIEGTFRARGTKESIKKFLMEGLQPAVSFGDVQKIKREIADDEDDYLEIDYILEDATDDTKRNHPESLHIPRTRRNFIQLTWSDITAYKNKNGDFVFASDFKGAWCIDTDTIKELAKEYAIDIRVNGFERGMEFEQLFEVDRTGWIKCESVIRYIDYTWECPMPLLGG